VGRKREEGLSGCITNQKNIGKQLLEPIYILYPKRLKEGKQKKEGNNTYVGVYIYTGSEKK